MGTAGAGNLPGMSHQGAKPHKDWVQIHPGEKRDMMGMRYSREATKGMVLQEIQAGFSDVE